MDIEDIFADSFPYINIGLAIGGAYYVTNELINSIIMLDHGLTVIISLIVGVIVYSKYDKDGELE